jgi:hypothetical protein
MGMVQLGQSVYMRSQVCIYGQDSSIDDNEIGLLNQDTNTCNEIQETSNFVCSPYYWQVRYFS